MSMSRAHNALGRAAPLVVMVSLLLGCVHSYKEVGGKELHRAWTSAMSSTETSWWYEGSSSDHHYFVLRRTIGSDAYKVRRSEIVLIDVPEFAYSWIERREFNLHNSNVRFPGESSP